MKLHGDDRSQKLTAQATLTTELEETLLASAGGRDAAGSSYRRADDPSLLSLTLIIAAKTAHGIHRHS